MNNSYFLTTFLPVVAFVVTTIFLASLVSYRLQLTDQFLWFKQQISKTKDYDAIYDAILQTVHAEGDKQVLTPQVLARISGAAEKAVPQLRLHGRIEVRLPALYEVEGKVRNIVVTLKMES